MEAGIISEMISGLAVLALVALAVWLRRQVLTPIRKKAPSAARRTIRGLSRHSRTAWLERVARRKGMSVVWRVRRGPEYATITWKGAVDMDTYRFRDIPTYRRVQQSERRTIPTRTSCCGSPPRVGHLEKLSA